MRVTFHHMPDEIIGGDIITDNGDFVGTGVNRAQIEKAVLMGGDGNDELASLKIGGVGTIKGGMAVLKGEGGDDSLACERGASTVADGGSGSDMATGGCQKLLGIP